MHIYISKKPPFNLGNKHAQDTDIYNGQFSQKQSNWT